MTVDGMRAVEELNAGLMGDAEAGVMTPYASVFVGDPFIRSDTVMMASFDHEGAWGDESGHFGIIESVTQVELGHFVLPSEEVTERSVDRDVFADPLIEIGGTDGEGVIFEDGRDPHGGLSAVGETIKADPRWIDVRERLQPTQSPLMLVDDEREKGEAEWICLALENAKAVLSPVGVMGGPCDEATFCQTRSEASVVFMAWFGGPIEGMDGQSFESVLADDDRPWQAGLEVSRHGENAPGEKSLSHRKRHLVSVPFRSLEQGSRCDFRFDVVRRRQSADDVFPELLTLDFDEAGLTFERQSSPRFPEESFTLAFAVPEEALNEVLRFADASELSGGDVGGSGGQGKWCEGIRLENRRGADQFGK